MGPVIRFEGRPFRVYDGIPPRQGQRYDLRIAGTGIQQSIAIASGEQHFTSRRAGLCAVPANRRYRSDAHRMFEMGPVIRFEGRPFRVYDGIPPRQGQRYDLRIAGTGIQQSIADASAEHQPCPKENSTSRGGRAILCSRMAETIRCRQSIPETNDLIRLDNYRHPLCGTCESQVVEYTGTPFCVETMALWHGENRRIHATQPGAVPAIRRYRNGPVSLSASRPHPCTERIAASTPRNQVQYLRFAGTGMDRCPFLRPDHTLARREPLHPRHTTKCATCESQVVEYTDVPLCIKGTALHPENLCCTLRDQVRYLRIAGTGRGPVVWPVAGCSDRLPEQWEVAPPTLRRQRGGRQA